MSNESDPRRQSSPTDIVIDSLTRQVAQKALEVADCHATIAILRSQMAQLQFELAAQSEASSPEGSEPEGPENEKKVGV